jgi:hypothetical protein
MQIRVSSALAAHHRFSGSLTSRFVQRARSRIRWSTGFDLPRQTALGSIQQEYVHCFTRCLAANDSRGEALTRAVILALLRMEA